MVSSLSLSSLPMRFCFFYLCPQDVRFFLIRIRFRFTESEKLQSTADGGAMSAQQTWYNRSTWRGFFEPSASHTWLLSKSEPKANDAVSGHGIISSDIIPAPVRAGRSEANSEPNRAHPPEGPCLRSRYGIIGALGEVFSSLVRVIPGCLANRSRRRTMRLADMV